MWKIESRRLIAAIARVTHDIGIAEELAQDALVTALELWPEGIPENPGAWLMTCFGCLFRSERGSLGILFQSCGSLVQADVTT